MRISSKLPREGKQISFQVLSGFNIQPPYGTQSDIQLPPNSGKKNLNNFAKAGLNILKQNPSNVSGSNFYRP